MGISPKEIKESRVDLKILRKVNYGDESRIRVLLEEVEQLTKIIATIIKNKESNSIEFEFEPASPISRLAHELELELEQ